MEFPTIIELLGASEPKKFEFKMKFVFVAAVAVLLCVVVF